MVSAKMKALGVKKSVIREIFEYAKVRKAEIGAENVFDYSIGNPSVPAPDTVKDSLVKLLTETDPAKLHGYTSAQGDPEVRRAIADHLNETYGANASPDLMYLTVGAAAALTISLNAVLLEGEEVIVFAPFFPEYRVFVEKAGGKLVSVPCRESDFQIDLEAFEKAITPKTKAVIVNSPNNPTGVVLSEETIVRLSEIMVRAEEAFGHPIFLIADEPYRELVYNGVDVPYLTRYYADTIVCYSFSNRSPCPANESAISSSAPTARKQRTCTPPCSARDVHSALCARRAFSNT